MNPRFFCENCGAEVPRAAKNCPRCGKYFASVKCPGCGFVGEEELFKEGCPVCGYSTAPAKESGGQSWAGPSAAAKRPAGSLPFWVYLVTLLALFLVGAALYMALR
jgi:rRNA maturation protein Nop10